jgi:hypothetical protein
MAENFIVRAELLLAPVVPAARRAAGDERFPSRNSVLASLGGKAERESLAASGGERPGQEPGTSTRRRLNRRIQNLREHIAAIEARLDAAKQSLRDAHADLDRHERWRARTGRP